MRYGRLAWGVLGFMVIWGSGVGAAGGQTSLMSGLSAGPFRVGYKIIVGRDASRSFGSRYDGAGRPQSGLQARAMKLHVWYPARPNGRLPMAYAEYIWEAAELAAAAPLTAEFRIAAESEYRALPLRRKAAAERLAGLLTSPTRAVRDAALSAGRFPLILYAPSINADPYENAVLFEYLASHGYVVASAPCVGLLEQETGRNRDGAAAQFEDLRFVLSRAVEEAGVDEERVGALGFSWGGTSVLLLALQHAGLDAVATLDGAAGFAEYRPVARSFSSWTPQNLRAAFLEVLPSDEPREPAFGGKAKYADWYLWRVPGVRHSDFAADSQMKLRWAASDPAFDRTWAFYIALAGRLKDFFDAALKGDRTAAERLKAPAAGPDGSSWAFEASLPPPPTAAEFDRLIREKGVDAATAQFDAVRSANPEAIIFDEARLLKYAVEWGPERAGDLEKLLRLQLRAYPDSAEGHFWLAQVYLAQEDSARAAAELDIVLKLSPGHDKAKRLLDKLRKSP